LGFTTRLVGICNAIPSQLCSSSGGASIPLFEWTWTDTFNGTSGGVAKTYNMLPLDPGSGTGDIHITGLNGAPQVPPSVSCSANPSILWPPNGKAVLVTVSGNIAQGTQAIPSGGTAYAVTDEYGEIQPSGNISLGPGGAYSFGIALAASRNGGDRNGRTYTISVTGRDQIGNIWFCSAVVAVPHDQGKQ